MIKKQKKIETKIGEMYLIASENGLQGIFWKDQKISKNNGEYILIENIFDETEKQLNEYFKGLRENFNLRLDLIGTDFQIKVWKELLKIKYGQTKSYQEIAIAIGDNNASRAVGTANGKNPISIIVPCHRVINKNGNLGGYAGGIKIKKILLNLERANFNF